MATTANAVRITSTSGCAASGWEMAVALNFDKGWRFLVTAEEECAALILRAFAEGRPCSLLFPPLQPKFLKLLLAMCARFRLEPALKEWGGDEQRLFLSTGNLRIGKDSRSEGGLPGSRVLDWRPSLQGKGLARRLADAVRPADSLEGCWTAGVALDYARRTFKEEKR